MTDDTQRNDTDESESMNEDESTDVSEANPTPASDTTDGVDPVDESVATDETEVAETEVAETEVAETETSSGLDENVAGALSYLLGPITGILFYLIEEENEFVRFHAVQSTIVFGGLVVLSLLIGVLTSIFALIPIIGWIIGLVLGLVSLLLAPIGLVLWVLLMYKAYDGDRFELPVVGEMSAKYV